MDDFSFLWYIIAAVIYFLTRKRTKGEKSPQSEDRPKPSRPQKSFDELLKEITGRASDQEEKREEEKTPQTEVQPAVKKQEPAKNPSNGARRAFADVESRKIYEESIKMAEGADIEFAPDDDYRKPSLFRKYSDQKPEKRQQSRLATDIRNELKNSESTRKAIIYSEILNRKYG